MTVRRVLGVAVAARLWRVLVCAPLACVLWSGCVQTDAPVSEVVVPEGWSALPYSVPAVSVSRIETRRTPRIRVEPVEEQGGFQGNMAVKLFAWTDDGEVTLDVPLAARVRFECARDYLIERVGAMLVSSDEGLQVVQRSDRMLRVAARGVGEYEVRLVLRTRLPAMRDDPGCEGLKEGDVFEVPVSLKVSVERPSWAVSSWRHYTGLPCSSRLIRSGSPIPFELPTSDNLIAPELRLEGQGVFIKKNPAVDGLRGISVSGDGVLKVVLPDGVEETFEVVPDERLDGLDMQLMMHGTWGVSLELEDGETYGAADYTPREQVMSRALLPELGQATRGGACVHGAVGLDEVVMELETPEVCAPVARGVLEPLKTAACQSGSKDRELCEEEQEAWLEAGVSARLQKDGVCVYRLRAPAFAGGDGVAVSRTVTFTQTEVLPSR